MSLPTTPPTATPAQVPGAQPLVPSSSVLSPVHEIVAELKAGRMVILVDEEDRENEGDLVLATDFGAEIGRASCRERV